MIEHKSDMKSVDFSKMKSVDLSEMKSVDLMLNMRVR